MDWFEMGQSIRSVCWSASLKSQILGCLHSLKMQNTFEKELIQVRSFFDEAAEELKRQNRFSNEKLDNVVHMLIYNDANAKKIRAGTVWNRARKYRKHDAEYRFINCAREQFQGYDKNGSFVNLNASNGGRCNPQYIPCLYVSESPTCCISELDPQIGDYMSVARIFICTSI